MARPSTRPRSSRNGVSDLRGAARLVIEATRGVTDVVESMHHNIARVPGLQGPSSGDRTGGITGLVYRSVRGVTRLVGGGVDALLALCETLVAPDAPAPWRENAIAAVNGVIGDHLEASGNPLAIGMSLRRDGHPLGPGRAAIAQAIPQPGSHLLVLVHGLCMNDLQWNWKGHDHGAVLSAATGCTAVYARYNSGRHISQNGRDFAEALRALVADWPVTVERMRSVTTFSARPPATLRMTPARRARSSASKGSAAKGPPALMPKATTAGRLQSAISAPPSDRKAAERGISSSTDR